MKPQNGNGLTYREWLDAAGRTFPSAESERAWKGDEDPTDYRKAKEAQRNQNQAPADKLAPTGDVMKKEIVGELFWDSRCLNKELTWLDFDTMDFDDMVRELAVTKLRGPSKPPK